MESTTNFNRVKLKNFNNQFDSSYDVKKQTNLSKKKYNIPRLNTYLNKSEIKNLKKLEKISNKSSKLDIHNNDIMNLSIKEFIEHWANNNINIFSDIVQFFSNITNYKGYFNDIDKSENWTIGIYIIIKDFTGIFKKDKRSIYIGVTLILISILIYFIQITS